MTNSPKSNFDPILVLYLRLPLINLLTCVVWRIARSLDSISSRSFFVHWPTAASNSSVTASISGHNSNTIPHHHSLILALLQGSPNDRTLLGPFFSAQSSAQLLARSKSRSIKRAVVSYRNPNKHATARLMLLYSPVGLRVRRPARTFLQYPRRSTTLGRKYLKIKVQDHDTGRHMDT